MEDDRKSLKGFGGDVESVEGPHRLREAPQREDIYGTGSEDFGPVYCGEPGRTRHLERRMYIKSASSHVDVHGTSVRVRARATRNALVMF